MTVHDATGRATAGTFGAVLRGHRVAAALSQEALSGRAGVSVRAVSDLERGVKQRPHLETVRRLADALGLADAERAELASARSGGKLDKGGDVADGSVVVGTPLPLPATLLIGRDAEVAEIADVVARRDARLVTLTGPAGVGKTRLALTVAWEVESVFPDGAWFVDLTTVADPSMVLPAVAQALGLRDEASGTLGDRLRTFLRPKTLMLLVDNVEHVVEAAPELAELLAAAPGLAILATSRIRLRVSWEREVAVEPLAVPGEAAGTALEALAAPAVELFVARAAAARAGFALRDADAPAVAEVCRRLDGLPLAIELAAARMRVLTPGSLLERLDQRFAVLSGGDRDRKPRQRTLWDAVAWSHDLLSDPERTLFRRLAVFSGGLTLEAADAVAGKVEEREVDGGALGEHGALVALAALADQSLVQRREGPGGDPRFVLLETIREFALIKLREAGEEETVRERHAAYFANLAESAERAFAGPGEGEALDRCEVEIANFRAALGWSTGEEADATHALRIATALYWLWHTRIGFDEGRRWNMHVAARLEARALPGRGRALAVEGALACFQADYAAAEHLLERSGAACRYDGDARTENWASFFLGVTHLVQGRNDPSQRLIEDGLAGFERVGDQLWVGFSFLYLAALNGFHLRDGPRGIELFEAAVEHFRSIGSPSGIAASLGNMGALTLKMGDVRRAEALIREALEIRLAQADRWGLAEELHELAHLAATERDGDRGVRLYAASIALLDSLQTEAPAIFVALWQETEDWLRERADDPRFAAAWAEGYRWPIEQAEREVALMSGESLGIAQAVWPRTGDVSGAGS